MDNVTLEEVKVCAEIANIVKDVLPNTITETDGAVSTLVGLFNNVVLYPAKKANIIFRYKLEFFESEFKEKYCKVPGSQRCKPKVIIVGPVLEALKYTFDEQKLREMYINLLVSSMDTEEVKKVHPSFVEIIKQLSPSDAVFLNYLKRTRKALIDYEFQLGDYGGFFGQNLILVRDKHRDGDIEANINNYIRLGIFEKISTDRDSSDFEFDEVEKIAFNKCKSETKEDFEHEFSEEELHNAFRCKYYWLQLTSLGENFVATCTTGGI